MCASKIWRAGSCPTRTASSRRFFFFNDPATTEIYTTYDTLSLHDALPILERVPADLVRGEGDRVRRRHEIAVAGIDDRSVFTDSRTDDDAGIPNRVLVEDRLQCLGTKLADWQELHRAE